MTWHLIDDPDNQPPDNNVRVLLFVPPYGAMSGNFVMETGRWNCHACLNREAQPTHWMPLPPPPDTQEIEG